jgi:hypothetical protein
VVFIQSLDEFVEDEVAERDIAGPGFGVEPGREHHELIDVGLEEKEVQIVQTFDVGLKKELGLLRVEGSVFLVEMVLRHEIDNLARDEGVELAGLPLVRRGLLGRVGDRQED